MKKLHFSRLILICLAVSLRAQQSAASPSLPVAQPPQTAPDSSTVTLEVKAKLTVEDVTVTDAKGKPVRGLTQSDFIVKEDGKPQAIRNFQEYGASAAQVPPPSLPPGTYTNRQAAAPSAVNILLLDGVTNGGNPFLSIENLTLAKQQAIKYLRTMPEGTQIAILRLANGVSVVQGFTSNRDVLLAAIGPLKPDPVAGAYLLPPPPNPPLIEICAVENAQSEITTAALAGIAGFVSGIKGRKNLIWFTAGIPWLTHYDLFSRVGCLRDYSPQLHNAYGLLNAARVAIYPVDPKGLRMMPMEDQQSMQDIANSTGGKAYYNRNDLDAAIGEAIAAGSDYYSLSYVPPLSKYDGKYHTINVKVDRPGLNLLYREGYTALNAVQPQPVKEKSGKEKPGKAPGPPESQFHAAMNHGPDLNDLTFYVHLQPSAAASAAAGPPVQKMNESLNPKLKGQPLTPYTFQYLILAGDITFAGGNPSGTQTASAELAIAVFGPDGELLNAAGQTTVYSIPQNQAAQFMNQPSRVSVQIDLPPGKLLVRVGVLDVASQKMGILEIPQTVARE